MTPSAWPFWEQLGRPRRATDTRRFLKCSFKKRLKNIIDVEDAAFLRRYLVGHSKEDLEEEDLEGEDLEGEDLEEEDLEAAKDFDMGAHIHNYRSFAIADLTLDHMEDVKSSLPEEGLASDNDFESDG